MQPGPIGSTRLIPEGPAPPRPPERLRPSESAAAIGRTSEMRLLISQVSPAEPSGEVITAEEIRQRISEHVRQVFERAGIAFEEMSAEEAAARVAPGGYWSAESTAQRILDFVAAYANGEPERAQLLREAVEAGFAEAEEAFGGTLPEISYETIDLVREGLDRLFAARVDASA